MPLVCTILYLEGLEEDKGSTLVVLQSSAVYTTYLSITLGCDKGVMHHTIHQDGLVTFGGLAASHITIYANIQAT